VVLRFQGQGSPQGAAAQGRQQGRLGGAETAARQFLGNERIGQGGEGQLLAAGDHRGKQVCFHPGGENEKMLGRRFLQGFQQGIDCLVFHLVAGFDEGHPPVPGYGRVGGETAKLPVRRRSSRI